MEKGWYALPSLLPAAMFAKSYHFARMRPRVWPLIHPLPPQFEALTAAWSCQNMLMAHFCSPGKAKAEDFSRLKRKHRSKFPKMNHCPQADAFRATHLPDPTYEWQTNKTQESPDTSAPENLLESPKSPYPAPSLFPFPIAAADNHHACFVP